MPTLTQHFSGNFSALAGLTQSVSLQGIFRKYSTHSHLCRPVLVKTLTLDSLSGAALCPNLPLETQLFPLGRHLALRIMPALALCFPC